MNPSSSTNPNDDGDDDRSPLWRYVTITSRHSDKGGNSAFTCNLCNHSAKGSYPRVNAHLLRIPNKGIKVCSKVSPSILKEINRVMEEAERRRRIPEVPLPNSAHGTLSSTVGCSYGSNTLEAVGKKRKADSAIGQLCNTATRDQLTCMIARMFYSGALPFHHARNPYYTSSYTLAANSSIPGFIPPGYNSLRTTLLQRERNNIEMLLEPTKKTWGEKGVSLVTDGWSDPQRRPLINFMAITDSKPIFLKAINCEGEYKNAEFISKLMIDTINEVGHRNVVQVITDNAPVCKAAGMVVESKFSHIFWTPCVVHTLNLALKSICTTASTERNVDAQKVWEECKWIPEISGDATMIKNFITNHSMRLAMYNEFVSLKLLSVAETRFASTIVMLRRFKLVKQGLLAMVISERWSAYREDDTGKAQFVKELILNDIWWDKIDYILSFTRPIYDMLRFADTDKPCLHLIYDMWDSMIESVKKIIYRQEGRQEDEESEFYSVVYSILVSRWNKSNSPLHCMAHSLNPRYYSDDWLKEAPNRVPPHRDEEISEERNKCFRRFFPNNSERKIASLEFAKFSGCTDSFGSTESLHDRGDTDPMSWWLLYGASTPLLQTIALKLLGQPCSSSCSERNWSTYSFIHSMKRNKIQPQRAEDLVYVHTNLRLLSRRSEGYTKGESKMWDIGGDVFEPFDGAGELEIANLSLDESDLEAVLFNDDNGVDVIEH